MAGWQRHQGKAVPLPLENVDTDQIIPARFMSTPRSEGYGEYLFHDMARDAAGTLRPDFPLTHVPDASVLITRRNFGCGSSREAAVYALVDAGFRAVIAPSFGDIFAANAVNNGLLPAKVTEEEITALFAVSFEAGVPAEVDLGTCHLTIADKKVAFEIDPIWRTKLMSGWDDIDLTRDAADQIADHRARLVESTPWVFLPPAVGVTRSE